MWDGPHSGVHGWKGEVAEDVECGGNWQLVKECFIVESGLSIQL